MTDLATFLRDHARDGGPALVAAVRTQIIASGGCWIPGDDAAPTPASHLVEISLFGIIGRGDTAEAAACDWRRAALQQCRHAA